ncbi:ribosome assembly RNA-binding protein YhbY [Allofrancisella guangzhouensis]|uniref:RNA-binding protein n=1 Tax=Allofrancisella guangzhouensis TaxID=594679 RepID=A0A0A8E601_9GAMM|nr:ribosome assembly RNA-binding protein YhbY [Allofrancisella guangzhouensis]AJC49409.1 RNA-binding protein [Allofrancisella guangzhouensis]MBK2026699.1 ribosome assembly RNA-binding protein YhbY [Allofrancisella guangzhouensis]MBK2043959.1 ribosome assembly RNA-binding protein YhbY [Allofrancisella guangzhouensis]MBK2046221.1 ribosome assembly RNA-binding protein YhbY [Allofrancisella guangzhouensis]
MDVKQQQELKSLAHKLKPVVLIGEKGLTENVLLEIDLALATHELIKVKVFRAPKEYKEELSARVIQATKCELVQIIGNILVLYRKNPNKKK